MEELNIADKMIVRCRNRLMSLVVAVVVVAVGWCKLSINN